MNASRQAPLLGFAPEDSVDFSYLSYDLFHKAHNADILKLTLEHYRGNVVSEAGGVRPYLMSRTEEQFNLSSVKGFDKEEMHNYYSNASHPAPLNHPYADRHTESGETIQDYAGSNPKSFHVKMDADHQADHFSILDDLYDRLKANEGPSFESDHPNVHPASAELGFPVSNDSLQHDVMEARHTLTHRDWWVSDVTFQELEAALAIGITTWTVTGNLQNVPLALGRSALMQGSTLGIEDIVDHVRHTGIPDHTQFGSSHDLTGHQLLEANNFDVYAEALVVSVVIDLMLRKNKMSRTQKETMVFRRSVIVGSKLASGKLLGLLGVKAASAAKGGGAVGTPFGGPIGTAIGASIAVVVTVGWYSLWSWSDAKCAAKHQEIFEQAVRAALMTA
jgi:hypothetical protein